MSDKISDAPDDPANTSVADDLSSKQGHPAIPPEARSVLAEGLADAFAAWELFPNGDRWEYVAQAARRGVADEGAPDPRIQNLVEHRDYYSTQLDEANATIADRDVTIADLRAALDTAYRMLGERNETLDTLRAPHTSIASDHDQAADRLAAQRALTEQLRAELAVTRGHGEGWRRQVAELTGERNRLSEMHLGIAAALGHASPADTIPDIIRDRAVAHIHGLENLHRLIYAIASKHADSTGNQASDDAAENLFRLDLSLSRAVRLHRRALSQNRTLRAGKPKAKNAARRRR